MDIGENKIGIILIITSEHFFFQMFEYKGNEEIKVILLNPSEWNHIKE